MQTAKLNNGVEIPILGFGVFQITDCSQSTGPACKDLASGGFCAMIRSMNLANIGCGVVRALAVL